ncbi:MAG TPA: hypothetical protein VEB40_09555, partial [Flavipsychrobacter sp.]|nr:hypothetical protein [Flavipsychrobacter sp.]
RLLAFDDKVELLTPTEERSFCGVNSFRIRNIPYDNFYKICSAGKIRVRGVPENGINCIRVSTHIYNNTQEIDALMDLVEKAVVSG